MKIKKNLRPFISVFLIAALLITGAFAFLTSTDVKTNVFTSGYIDIVLHEDNWYDTDGNVLDDSNNNSIPDFAEDVLPGQQIEKEPYIENTGLNDAWVFMSVAVPTALKKDLISINNDGQVNIEGEKIDVKVTGYAIQEGFVDKETETKEQVWAKYASESSALTSVNYETLFGTKATSEVIEARAELFNLVNNDIHGINTDEWTFMDTNGDGTPYYGSDGYNYYVYAYNTKLAKGANTASIFDNIELLSDIGISQEDALIDNGSVHLYYYIPENSGNKGVNGTSTSLAISAPIVEGKELIYSQELTCDENGEAEITSLYADASVFKDGYSFDWVDVSTGDAVNSGDIISEDKLLTADYSALASESLLSAYESEPKTSSYLKYSLNIEASSPIDASSDVYATLIGADMNSAYFPTTSTFETIIPNYLTFEKTSDGKFLCTNGMIYDVNKLSAFTDNSVELSYDTDTLKVPVRVINVRDNELFARCTKAYFPDAITSFTSWSDQNDTATELVLENVENFDIPYSCVTIGDNTRSKGIFGTNTKVKTVTTSSGNLTTIYPSAFVGCNELTSIELPNSLKTIGSYAFSKCEKLKSIVIPDSVTTLGKFQTFYKCIGLETVILGNSLESLGSYAFEGCTSITSITIPGSIKEISREAFAYCSSLEEVVIEDGVKTIGYGAFAVDQKISKVTLGNTIEVIGESAFDGCKLLKNLDIPDSVITIDTAAFNCSSLRNFTMGKNVQTIGRRAFDNCTFNSIELPSTLTSIGREAFRYCMELKSITIPGSVESIGMNAFQRCDSLTSVTLENGIKTIGEGAFPNSTTNEIVIPDSVQTIDENAFESVKMVRYSENMTATGSPWGAQAVNGYLDGDYAYADEAHTQIMRYYGEESDIVISDNITKICDGAFKANSIYDKLETVTLGSGVTEIGNEAFYNCRQLTTITFNSNLQTIGDRAFVGTKIGNFSEITLPASIVNIGNNIFNEDTWDVTGSVIETSTEIKNLVYTVNVPNTATNIASDAFNGVYDVVYAGAAVNSPYGAFSVNAVYDETTHAYYDTAKTTLVRATNDTVISLIPSTVTTIGPYACYEYASTTGSVDIPSSVASIGEYAFYKCSSSVTMTDNVTDIGIYAFKGATCSSIILSNNITEIPEGLFYACNFLENITVPDSVTCINVCAFTNSGCSTCEVTLPNHGITIKSHAFYNSYIASIKVSSAAAQDLSGEFVVEEKAFRNCQKLTSLILPHGITSIETRGIWFANKLTSITLPDTLENLATYAFSDCKGHLTTLTLPSSVKLINEDALAGISIDEIVFECTEFTVTGALGETCCESLIKASFAPGTTEIPDQVLRDCTALTTVSIPDGVERIGRYAFSGDTALTTIQLPDSIKVIDDNAFYECTNLQTINMPSSLETIEGYVFYNCWNLSSIVLPSGTKKINNYAFYGCTGLLLDIPDTITSFSSSSFAYDNGMITVHSQSTYDKLVAAGVSTNRITLAT